MNSNRDTGWRRFSLRSLLVVIAIVCITLGVTSPHSSVFAGVFAGAVFVGAPLAFLIGAIRARAYTRAFCVAALLPSAVALYMACQRFLEVPLDRIATPESSPTCFEAMAVAYHAGLACVAIRWIVVRIHGRMKADGSI